MSGSRHSSTARLGLVLLAFAYAVAPPAAAAAHYRMRVELRPVESALRVSGVISVSSWKDQIRELTLLLNRGFVVERVSCVLCAGYSFQAERYGTQMYSPDAALLSIRFRRPLRRREAISIRFAYHGKPFPTRWGETSAGPEWVELALYNSWFPMLPEAGRFTYDLSIAVEPGWRVSGAGQLTQTGPGEYRLRQSGSTIDMNVVASRKLKSFDLRDAAVPLRIDYTGLHESAAARMGRTSGAATAWFASWFGSRASRQLTIVFADRQRGGGYSRPGFLCYESGRMSRAGEAEVSASLAHEIAHLWWMQAPADSWEDWLNESFAEYSAMMFIREHHGQQPFEARLEELRTAGANTPAIRGLDRNSPQAYATLYQKGSVILYELERTMGRGRFCALLRALLQQKVASTSGLLACLEKMESPEARRRLERMLDSPGLP